MKKYRIIKRPGHPYPYMILRKGLFGWRPHRVYADGRIVYLTYQEAEKDLDTQLELNKSPVIMKEIEG